jgi:hypothetical protein
MAYIFGDGFDLYATMADPLAGYWDSGLGVGGANSLVAGRFAGGQAISMQSGPTTCLVKSSGANDAIHHIVVAFRQTVALSGTTLGVYFQLSDGATNQCCIVFRSDGAVLLTSATPAGTALATYTGAVTAANTWTAFEFEVVINNTTGAFRARKNGNTSNDFDSGAVLNTRPGANSYANKLTVAMNATVNAQQFDDVLWRSDASSVAWVGDVRAYVRMPASDASAQFTRNPATQTPFAQSTTSAISNTVARFTPFTASYDGAIGTLTVSLNAGYTGNMKCSIFAVSGANPGAVLGSATPISNPATGNNTLTFPTPVPVARGAAYHVGVMADTSSGTWNTGNLNSGTQQTGTTYAAFPTASPSVTLANAIVCTITVTISNNAALVNETIEDGAASYVYDSNPGDADFYNIAAISGTPVNVVAVTTRGFVQKSDAGTRNGAVQLKSGGTTVASPSTVLSTSFGWLWRTDQTDPATGAAWTPLAVNSVTIGPTVTA